MGDFSAARLRREPELMGTDEVGHVHARETQERFGDSGPEPVGSRPEPTPAPPPKQANRKHAHWSTPFWVSVVRGIMVWIVCISVAIVLWLAALVIRLGWLQGGEIGALFRASSGP